MAEPLHSQLPPSQRPPSPTELSYTQLVKLTPSHHGSRRAGSIAVASSSLQRNQNEFAAATPAAAHSFTASEIAPTAEISNNPVNVNSNNPAAAMSSIDRNQRIFRNAYTPQPQQFYNSLHGSRMTPLSNPPHTVHNCNLPNDPASTDRVANLAQKLRSQTIQSQSKQDDIQQFITMLQGMQHTVSRTADEQQRNRKSQALNLLLGMFERVLEERNQSVCDIQNDELDQLKERVRQIEEDNEQLHNFCKERDEELVHLHREVEQLNNENDELKQEISRVRDECNEERKRAREAELIASESESVRDGLFASYGQLTEANVELERAMEECRAEKQALDRDFEYCKEELSQLESQCNILHQQLKDKELEVAGSEEKLDEMHNQIASHLQSLESANSHRHRLQDELHASQRNATSLSQQLIEIREKYAQLQKETDANRRNQQADESETSNLAVQLQEEQLKRKDLEVQQTRYHSRELAAQEQIRKLVRTNAELKTKVNELNARLDSSASREKFGDSCSILSDASFGNKITVAQEDTPSLLDYLKPDSS